MKSGCSNASTCPRRIADLKLQKAQLALDHETRVFIRPGARHRLQGSGTRPLNRDQLPPGLRDQLPPGLRDQLLEDRAAAPPVIALGGEPDRARAAWAFAHGMIMLELNGRFPPTADLDAAWRAGLAAFG